MGDNGIDYLNIAVEGCCHGELDSIYATILDAEARTGVKTDLLLICGDFESIRDEYDLQNVAVPEKYRHMNSFQDYVTGRKVAPVTTIFIGGNHEASNFLHSLYYGGWAAPNIYFLGYAGVVWFGGVRIAGISGIYNSYHYRLGHYERVPYSEDMLKSIYHIRELEIFRLSHLCASKSNVDLFLSHDWPQGIWEYGNKHELLRKKPFFRDDIETRRLGAPPLMELLKKIKPSFWFAAHLHTKFAAVVQHYDSKQELDTQSLLVESNEIPLCAPVSASCTRFVALDKVLPGREFLQFLKVPKQKIGENIITLDSEWLAIVSITHKLLSTSKSQVTLPSHITMPSDELIDSIEKRAEQIFGGLVIPNIQATTTSRNSRVQEGNPQTDNLLNILGQNHVWTAPFSPSLGQSENAIDTSTYVSSDTNEISIDDI